jgi:hypothetical protein
MLQTLLRFKRTLRGDAEVGARGNMIADSIEWLARVIEW